MQFQRFLIAPLRDGLVSNLKSWLIPEQAFARLRNAYVWRGRLKKRIGSKWIENATSFTQSKVRIAIDTTDNMGIASGTVPGNYFNIGQEFSIDDKIYSVNRILAGVQPLLQDGTTTTATYDNSTGAYNFVGAPADSTVYFYPNLPITHITNYESAAINFEVSAIFDQQFVYTYDSAAEGFASLGPVPPAAGSAQWSIATNPEEDTFFHWSTNFSNADSIFPANNIDLLWVVNNRPLAGVTDGVKYYDGTNWTPVTFALTAANDLLGARLVIGFKGRLLFFSTIETAGTFTNRVRFSWTRSLIDNVTIGSDANAFFEESGKGGYIDAPTSEAIITAEFVKDRLVVYFERSTYQLLYTGSPDLPFTWQKIDTSIGAESMHSRVPFDNVTLGVGQSGIHACNGATVQRIDQNIPNTVFDIQSDNKALERVAGIRDYDEEMVYWCYPEQNKSPNVDVDFPQNVLAYNYETSSWAQLEDSITAFGHYYISNAFTWADWTPQTWGQSTQPWNYYGGSIDSPRIVIAGNQQGFIMQMVSNLPTNASVLSIQAAINSDLSILGILNHNLNIGDYIKITDPGGSLGLDGTTVSVTSVINKNEIRISINHTPDYTGGATAQRVSRVDILTKEYNFFTKQGMNTFIPYVEFLVDRATANGAILPGIQVDYFIGFNNTNIVQNSAPSGALTGTNFLETSPYPISTFEQGQQQFWHRIYSQATGDSVQYRLYFTDEQMFEDTITEQGLIINGILIYAAPNGTRLGI